MLKNLRKPTTSHISCHSFSKENERSYFLDGFSGLPLSSMTTNHILFSTIAILIRAWLYTPRMTPLYVKYFPPTLGLPQ